MSLRRRGRPRQKTSKQEALLMDKIVNGTATVGVVGLGYVGLPLALEFAKSGMKTIGIDVSKEKVRSLSKGDNYIQDLNDDEIRKVVKKDRLLTATTDFSLVAECDVIFICVPTPFTENKDPDISHVVNATKEVSKHLKKGQLGCSQEHNLPRHD